MPSPRILCHYKYLKHIALQPSLSLSHRHTSIHLFLFLLCCTIPLSDPLLPSFLLALQFLSLYTHFLTLYLYFLLHNSSNTNILLLKAHLYTPFQYQTYFLWQRRSYLTSNTYMVYIYSPTNTFMHNCSFLPLLIIVVAVW